METVSATFICQAVTDHINKSKHVTFTAAPAAEGAIVQVTGNIGIAFTPETAEDGVPEIKPGASHVFEIALFGAVAKEPTE